MDYYQPVRIHTQLYYALENCFQTIQVKDKTQNKDLNLKSYSTQTLRSTEANLKKKQKQKLKITFFFPLSLEGINIFYCANRLYRGDKLLILTIY